MPGQGHQPNAQRQCRGLWAAWCTPTSSVALILPGQWDLEPMVGGRAEKRTRKGPHALQTPKLPHCETPAPALSGVPTLSLGLRFVPLHVCL